MSEIDCLAWRCRRGMLELDLVLQRYLASRHEGLDERELAALNVLLTLPDRELYGVVFGNRQPPAELAAIVQELRRC